MTDHSEHQDIKPFVDNTYDLGSAPRRWKKIYVESIDPSPIFTESDPIFIAAKDTDVTLAANSDSKVATQKATKTYADTKLSAVVSDSPITGSGTSASHLSIGNAAADGSTKGVAGFAAADFTASSGIISLADTHNPLALQVFS